MKKSPLPQSSLVALACMAAFLLAPFAQAASSSWNVNAAGNWNASGNWLGSVIPGDAGGTTSTDIATFGFTLTNNQAVTVDANRNIGGITFSNTSDFRYTLQTGALRLSSGGVIQTAAGNGNHTDTINSAIEIQGNGGSATFTAGATSPTSLLSIGAVTGVSTGSNVTTLTLDGSNTGANAITGIIGNGSGGGKLAVVKSDAGTWTLSGTNTFTGGVTLNAGTLNINKAAALGTTAGTFTINGGTIANTSGGNITTSNYVQTWGGDFSFGSEGMFAEGNLNLGTGAVTLAGSGSKRAITVNGRFGVLTVGGVISDGATAKGIIKNGTGTLFLNTATNNFSGGVTLNNGILQLATSATSSALGAGQLIINGGALMNNGDTLAFSTNNTQAWNGDFAFVGTGRNYQPSTITFGTGAITLGKTLTVTNAGNVLTEGGAIGDGSAGYGVTWITGLYQYFSASTTLTGASTYSGATVIRSRNGLGATTMSTGTLANTSSVTVNSGGVFYVGTTGVGVVNRINAAASLTLGGNGGGTFRLTGSQNATVNEQSFTGLTVGTGVNTLYTDRTSNASRITLTGAIPYTRSVGGVVRINGLSTTGTTFTNAPGGATNVIGSGASAMLLGATYQNGSGLTDVNSFVKAASGALTALASTSNSWGTGVNTDVLPNTFALSGVTQSLRFNGGGNLTLPGAFTVESGGILATNNAAAPVTITGGTLKTGLAASDLWIVQGGAATTSTGIVIGSQIIDNGGSSLANAGPRALYLTNTNNTYAGGTYLGEGILNVASGGSLGTGSLNFTGVATLQAAGDAAMGNRAITISTGGIATFDTNGHDISSGGVISGASGSLTKTGVGTLTLSGANTYTGVTTVTDGTLKLDFTGASSPASDLINANSLVALGSPVYYGGRPQSSATSVTLAIQGKDGTANSQSFSGTSLNPNQSSTSIGQGMTHMNFSAGAGGTLTVNLGSIAAGVTNSGSPNTMVDISMGSGVTVTTSNVLAPTGALSMVTNSTTAQSNIPWITVNGNTFATLSGNTIVGLADSAYSTNYSQGPTYLDVRTTGTLTSPAGSNPGSMRFNDTNNTGADITLTLRQGGILTGVSGPILVTSNVGAHTSKITSGYLYGVFNPKDLMIAQNNTAGDLVIESQIMDTNSGATISKFGAGRVVLTANNTNASNTYVNEGTIVATGDYTPGVVRTITTTTGSAVVNMSDTSGLYLGQPLYGTGVQGSNALPNVIVAINPGVSITLSANITTGGTITGTFQSAGALGGFKSTAPTAYIGTSGTLQIGNGGTHGSLDPNNMISNLGALILSRSDTNTFGNTISGTVAINSLANTANMNTLEITGGGTTTFGAPSGVVAGSALSGNTAYTLTAPANVYAGQLVTGTGIRAGTTVSSVNGLTVTLSSTTTGVATDATFTTNNTFAGTTRITGGSTLVLGSATALGSSTLDYLSSGSGTLSFGAQTAATLGGLSGDKDLALTNASSAAVALTVGGNHLDNTYSGNLTGTGSSLTKVGIGTQTLTGTNSYTGGTTVSAGTLKGNSSSLQGSISAVAGAYVVFDQAATGTYTGAFSGAGVLSKTAAGALTLSGTNTNTGFTTVSEGTLQYAKTASLYNSTTGSWTANNIRVANGATLALNVGGTGEFNAGNVTTILTNLGGLGGVVAYNGLQAGSKIGFDTANSGGNFTVSNNIADSTGTNGGGSIGLTKLGTNTLTLTGPNTYSGETLVRAGTLLLSGSASIGNSATVNVSSGATLDVAGVTGGYTLGAAQTLKGDGTINGALTVAGNLAPGSSPGILTANNSVTIADGGKMTMEISGASVGAGYDQVTMLAGTFSLTGTNDLVLSLGYTPAQDALFFLVDNQDANAISGVFEMLNGSAEDLSQDAIFSVGLQQFQISYEGNVGGNSFTGGNDLVIQAVPEPSTWALLAFSLTTVMVLRRRRRM